jgi:hypothetical protein
MLDGIFKMKELKIWWSGLNMTCTLPKKFKNNQLFIQLKNSKKCTADLEMKKFLFRIKEDILLF